MYNVRIIIDIIESEKLHEDVSILISDNCSPDDTGNIVKQEILSCNKINIQIYMQKLNIGGAPNTIFTIKNTSTKYCMLLGDDDYINANYLARVIHEIKRNNKITCILPSYQAIYPDKTFVGNLGRDLNKKTRYYKKGFMSCCANIKRTTQMSGLVFRKDNLVELFTQKRMSNLYPQTFFVLKNILRGESLHITNYPVLVTHVDQSKKDWDYGTNGLLLDQFENCINLEISTLKTTILEIISIINSKYILRNIGFKVIPEVIKDKKTTLGAGCFFIFFVFYIIVEKYLKLIYWRILCVKKHF
jgi:glycosyltransferase involved in cell wall biosynthesis